MSTMLELSKEMTSVEDIQVKDLLKLEVLTGPKNFNRVITKDNVNIEFLKVELAKIAAAPDDYKVVKSTNQAKESFGKNFIVPKQGNGGYQDW